MLALMLPFNFHLSRDIIALPIVTVSTKSPGGFPGRRVVAVRGGKRLERLENGEKQIVCRLAGTGVDVIVLNYSSEAHS